MSFAFLVVSALASAPALAHITLEYPTPRTLSQKVGPCGARDSTRGETYTAFAPGAVITVRWRETIDHPGHYRISFDDDGDDDFVDPASFDDRYTAPSVLLDGIEDKVFGTYEVEVELPDIECERCTLQVVQVMTDKPPYGDGNDLYYQCADIALRRDAPSEGELIGDPPAESAAGCSHVASSKGFGAGGVALLLALTLVVGRRRPR